jgi:glycosyltransferase involved in cell wall biosynthesis
MEQEKVLLISCYFPPAGGMHVQRALSLARYLPQNGFKVFVLTAHSSVSAVDAGLVNEIPENVGVHRTWTFEPSFRLRKKVWSRLNSPGSGVGAKGKSIFTRRITQLFCPDPQVLWYPFAIRRASQLIRKEKIQTVLVTAPPFSAFLVANGLKRRFPHLCTIADVRDEWLEYFVKEFVFRGDEHVVARAGQIERAPVASCDRLVAVTATSLDKTRSRYPDQPSHKFVLIPNGYDPAAFSKFSPRSHSADRLVVTYTGTVYKPCSPKSYLEALDGLPSIRSSFETRFVGRIAQEVDRIIFENRKSSLRLVDFVPQKDALSYMEETDVLLLPWADRINIPGKLFEYLATGKPILALCYRDSEVARVMEKTSSGWCVDPDDIPAIQRVLTEIQALGGKHPRKPDVEAIRRYERPRLAAEYARVILEARRARTTSNSNTGATGHARVTKQTISATELEKLEPFPWPSKLIRHAHIWGPGYIRQRSSRITQRPKPLLENIWVTMADHYEPRWRGVDFKTALSRVELWRSAWPTIAKRCLPDSAGNPPTYTFFFPEEQYDPQLVEPLAQMTRNGIADVEVHIHHDGEGRQNFVDRITTFCKVLHREHGLLRKRHGTLTFGFIHGSWALDNSRFDGRCCGLKDEIRILKDLGCYADFTMPSGHSSTQARMVNTIYYCKGDPNRRKSYDQGAAVRIGGGIEGDLLMIPGPLGIRWKDRLMPRMETGEIAGDNLVTPYRVSRWADLAPRIGGNAFIKLYTHGAQENNSAVLLRDQLESTFSLLAAEAHRRGCAIYFVSAWQMYQAIDAIRQRLDPVTATRVSACVSI